jgi:hypothetical protein
MTHHLYSGIDLRRASEPRKDSMERVSYDRDAE